MGQVDVLSASAGAGKTYNMAYRYIRTLISDPSLYRHQLAVTFTNKATEELKQRILLYLNKLSNGDHPDFEVELHKELGLPISTIRKRATDARNYILHDYNNFSVLTIDKFFQRVIRAFIKELGIDLNFTLELQPDTLLDQAVDRIIDSISTTPKLNDWIMGMVRSKIDDNKAWDIKNSLKKIGKELFSEEYRSSAITIDDMDELNDIIERARQKVAAKQKQYIDLARQFVAVMDSEGLMVSDFKGGNGSSIALYAQKVAAGDAEAKPYKTALGGISDDAQWYSKGTKSRIEPHIATLRPILAQMVELHESMGIDTNTYHLLKGNYREFALMAHIRSNIDAICKEEGILPLSDVNDLITKLIADNDAPFIYEKVGNKFLHFMIDEFQDTSRGQWQNFVPLLHNALSQDEGSPVMLVGDVKQSIYRWRGGDWSLLAHDVGRRFENVKHTPLSKNFRSKEQVILFNNTIIDKVVKQIAHTLQTELPTNPQLLSPELRSNLCANVSDAYADLEQKVKEGSQGGYVTVLNYSTELLEEPKPQQAEEQGLTEEPQQALPCHPIISRIEDLQRRGFRAKDIAILLRNNKEVAKVATLLLDHKTAHPTSPYIFDVITQDALEIGSSGEVKFVVALLSLAVNPADTIALATVNDFLGHPYSAPLGGEQADFVAHLALLQPEEAFSQVMLHFEEHFSAEAIPYLQALHSTIIEFCSRQIADTALWLDWWNESGHKTPIVLPQGSDAITIMTIHKSKGLGFEAVIVPECSWSMPPMANSLLWATPNKPLSERITKFPIMLSSQKTANSAFSESYYTEFTMSYIDSLNTLYVALTRAKQELHLMIADTPSAASIGSPILNALADHPMAEYEALEGAKLYEFGRPDHFIPEVENDERILSESIFKTFSPTGKVAVKYNHQRHTDDNDNSAPVPLSPRDHGTLLHRVFEQATTLDDIYSAIEGLVIDGLLTPTEGEQLRLNIEQTMAANGEIAEWFDGSWERVLNEREIIYNGKNYRPDRVMIRGGEAVVIDYKFGLNKPDSYKRQIKFYAQLLRQMGYKKVSGYLWYISMGQLDKEV